jgi:hypothetical protein
MSELAFNINGEAFEVPAEATGWRVRKMRGKGPPELQYGRDGLPLVLSIDAELEDLRNEVPVTGRYRLDLVDQNNKALADVPSGYVQVNHEATMAPSNASPSSTRPSDNIVVEAMRLNAELAKSIVDRFPLMLEASAHLLRAADGAGLPARIPRETESDDDDDETNPAVAATPGFDLINALVAQLVPTIINSMSGKKMPSLGALLDWRKAQPKADSGTPRQEVEPVSAKQLSTMPPLDPKMMGHFIAIQSALTPAEAGFARELAGELAPAEMRAWFDELGAMSVSDAVTKIRSILSSMKAGGAS